MTPDSPIKNGFLNKSTVNPPKDFEDVNINPNITYRHILSQNLGIRDPFRVIALCDSDAFYANCEMVRLGVDPNTPLVVLQWDSLIAVNYPARKYGISRMDKKKDALKRCPHLKVVHVATYREGDTEPGYWEEVDTNTHKVGTLESVTVFIHRLQVSLDHYRRESMKIATMFKEHLSGCEVGTIHLPALFEHPLICLQRKHRLMKYLLILRKLFVKFFSNGIPTWRRYPLRRRKALTLHCLHLHPSHGVIWEM